MAGADLSGAAAIAHVHRQRVVYTGKRGGRRVRTTCSRDCDACMLVGYRVSGNRFGTPIAWFDTLQTPLLGVPCRATANLPHRSQTLTMFAAMSMRSRQ